MAGTATNFNQEVIRAGSAAQIWAGLAVPGAGAKLLLDANGTPDATANPNALHLGLTRAGATLTLSTSGTEDFFADEQVVAVHSIPGTADASIAAEFLQVFDMDIMAILSPNTGTPFAGAAVTGPPALPAFEGLTFGDKAIAYTSIAVIFPVQGYTNRFAVWHLYKTYNQDGVSFVVDRKGMSGTSATFKGFGITTRAANDTVGAWWFETT